MLAALGKILNVYPLFLIPIAAVWGFVILSFDGWLIASTHGMLGRAKYRIFIPRIIISVLMGVIIAEPLLLWVFQPTIRADVLNYRRQQLTSYESQLAACNPPSGVFVATPSCSGLHLSLPNSPTAIQQQLATTTMDDERLTTLVNKISAQYNAKVAFADAECAGAKGTGLSGRIGYGPDCQHDRIIAAQYRADNQLSLREAALTALNAKVVQLTSSLATARHEYGAEAAAAVQAKVAGIQHDEGKIGLLDEEASLGLLSSRSTFVFSAQWLLRLLLIAIDCLPVLTKMMSGTTAYDHLVARQTSVSQRLHEQYMTLREGRDGAANQVSIERTEHQLRTRMQEIDEQDRVARARHEADMENEIDALAARLRQQDKGSDDE